MENEQRIKTISTDSRSKKRLRFSSSKQRAKTASADVYRSYKRRIGVTSSASREERVHHPNQDESRRKRQRKSYEGGSNDRIAVLGVQEHDGEETSSDSDLDTQSTFAIELDLAHDRNPSDIFSNFYRDSWHLVRSLPEVLHHATEIVDICIAYVLSPETSPEEKSTEVKRVAAGGGDRLAYVANRATADVLHLLAVLARDLRHEMHPHVHSQIVPRIVYDLLNPPLPPPESGKQPLPLSVTLVEAAFRTLSYVIRYDSEPILADVEKEGQEPCLEKMRQYYGATLGHKRDYVRRLAAETFAPMIRKLKTDGGKKRHIRRVLRALAASGKEVQHQEQEAISHGLRRAQSDAIDGVSFLLFESARGIEGRLHSKGHQVIRCVLECLAGSSSKGGMEVLYIVVSSFVGKVCNHLHRENFSIVWKEVFKMATAVALPFVESTGDESSTSALPFVLELIGEIVTFKSGIYIRRPDRNRVVDGYDESVQTLVELLRRMLDPTAFSRLSSASQTRVLKVLTASWGLLPDHPSFAAQISPLLPGVLSQDLREGCGDKQQRGSHATVLARDLLPNLPPESGVKLVGRAILAAAAKQARSNPSGALLLLFYVSSVRPVNASDKGSIDDDDRIFFVEKSSVFSISSVDKGALVDVCLADSKACCADKKAIAKLGVAARCLPFLLFVGKSENGANTERASYLEKFWQWAVSVWTALDEAEDKVCSGKNGSFATDDLVVAKSLVLESYALVASVCIEKSIALAVTKKDAIRMRPYAEKLLLAHPDSIWAVKGVAAFVSSLSKFDAFLSESPNQVFDALIPNLRQRSHFLRLHSLEILASFPTRPFVTDHAEIDWADDLDEEPLHVALDTNSEPGGKSATPAGLCGVIDTLLQLEATPICLANERKVISCITRIEVLGRCHRIPVAYAEAASNHLLGILHVKFSPLWVAAVRALVALASTHEAHVWEPLAKQIREVVVNPNLRDATIAHVDRTSVLSHVDHHERCVQWEISSGSDPGLFRCEAYSARENGRVSRHLTTDDLTVFRTVWSVLEGAPELTAKKSRTIVPVFLGFLSGQYFRYHDNDPDARELHLKTEVGDSLERSQVNSVQTRRILDQQLESYLKVFAAVNGPQQIYRHHELLAVFTSFVAHQDLAVAKAALSCVLKFKRSCVVPYADYLKGMLKKGELRETMLNFDMSKEANVIDEDHRAELIPLVSRIMFGRLSARSAISKSSKETPATRRVAVLSFLSVLDGQGGELYPLFYQMARGYIPRQFKLKPVEIQNRTDKENVLDWLQSVETNDLSHLRDQRHEGFLNLLSTAVAQLGHDIEAYVPAFMSIVLAICKHAEIGRKTDLATSECGYDAEEADLDRDTPRREPSRKGVLRTLCFRVLGDIYQKYASSVHFLPYAPPLWEGLSGSVHELPVTAAYADKAPALLQLLKALSAHPRLIPILSTHDEAVPCVMKCIADTSRQSVANAALDFVDNLLSNGSDKIEEDLSTVGDWHGIMLIKKHLLLLLRQFAIRLGSKRLQEEISPVSPAFSPQAKGVNTQCTRRRELSILCRLSSLIVDGSADVSQQEVLQMLCRLLVPFLSPDRRSSEQDQANIVRILSALISRIEGTVLLNYFASLSRLFGPYKARRGITSLAVRKSIASVIETIGNAGTQEKLKPIADLTLRLCALHSKRVDEIDYDVVLGALNTLGSTDGSKGWLDISGSQSSNEVADPAILSPLVCLCFHFLYDEDGVVSRASFKALKALISVAAVEAPVNGMNSGGRELTISSRVPSMWVKLIETTVVPTCRSGLTAKSQSVRRLFILLFAELARCFKGHTSTHLFGDLSHLIRDDDPDLDFFLNVTHVQIHRRSRALQRLGKMLVSGFAKCPFSMHSLSNFLMPLAMHPVYESKTKADEALAMDAVETIGAIAAHLSWNKYHAVLWTMLTQFERHHEQERYLVGAICSVIDAFHFDLVDQTHDVTEVVTGSLDNFPSNNAVWRALERRIIPRVESLLMKEKLDRSGTKVKILRPSVLLALLKLFRKFPTSFFESRLTRHLALICDSLKSRDSDARDVARKALAKMMIEMGTAYLSDVVRQLAVTLKEGYQLHVRMATLHTILQELAKTFQPLPMKSETRHMTPFDHCIPAMMDLIQQDLFGSARERKEAEGAMKRLVKEASGSKSADSLELISRMLTFAPSSVARGSPANDMSTSAVHAVVSPLLERLRTPDVTARTIGRIGECLTRVIVGLSHNETVTPGEIFPFVYASIAPFVGQYQSLPRNYERSEDDGGDDEDYETTVRVSHSGADGSEYLLPSDSNPKNTRTTSVVEWRPSTLKAAKNNIDARAKKTQERNDLRRVQDGASAPKLTGSGRLSTSNQPSTPSMRDPAAISGVTFGLSLLHSSLKKGNFDVEDKACRSMLDPFIPMLTRCVCECRNNDVILLSLRCLGVLLRLKLPSVQVFSSSLGIRTLDILTSSGNISNLKQELAQSCFKTMTLLMNLDEVQPHKRATRLENGSSMPLDAEQMQVLVSLLKGAVIESDHHHPTLALIKAIVARQFVSSEFYDLMDTMLDLSVKSHQATLRQLSAKIFMQYLVGYPMGGARLEDHLKHVVLNVKYEYEEGRLSAISLVTSILDKLPIELLERYAQLFFLPLVLQFVNDESKACRGALSSCLSRLLSRAPIEVIQSFYDYTERWSSGTGPLKRTALQLFGLFVDARPDFIQRGDNASALIDQLYEYIRDPSDKEWEIQYFALLCMEKLSKSSISPLLETHLGLWTAVVDNLRNRHPWNKRVSSRIIGGQLNGLDPECFVSIKSHFLLEQSGTLYKVARNLTSHLDLDESEQDEELSSCAIKSLVWIIQAMKHHPELCFAEGAEMDRNPVTWLITRLSNIAKPKGEKRREGTFKCFAAFIAVGGLSLVKPYMELILEPLHRSISESDQMMESARNSSSRRKLHADETAEATMAKDVLHLLEGSCGDDPEAFLRAFGAVKMRAREKRENRKKQILTEAVVDPQASAMRKIKKHEQEKRRRKRKVEGRRQSNGRTAKRRQHRGAV